MVGLDWLDLDFFFDIVFLGVGLKMGAAGKKRPGFGPIENGRGRQKGSRGTNLEVQSRLKRPHALKGPLGPQKKAKNAPCGHMGPLGPPHGPTLPLRECRRHFTLVG